MVPTQDETHDRRTVLRRGCAGVLTTLGLGLGATTTAAASYSGVSEADREDYWPSGSRGWHNYGILDLDASGGGTTTLSAERRVLLDTRDDATVSDLTIDGNQATFSLDGSLGLWYRHNATAEIPGPAELTVHQNSVIEDISVSDGETLRLDTTDSFDPSDWYTVRDSNSSGSDGSDSPTDTPESDPEPTPDVYYEPSAHGLGAFFGDRDYFTVTDGALVGGDFEWGGNAGEGYQTIVSTDGLDAYPTPPATFEVDLELANETYCGLLFGARDLAEGLRLRIDTGPSSGVWLERLDGEIKAHLLDDANVLSANPADVSGGEYTAHVEMREDSVSFEVPGIGGDTVSGIDYPGEGIGFMGSSSLRYDGASGANRSWRVSEWRSDN